MSTTGAKIAGTGTSVARGTATAWTNPGNITANDGTVASCNSGTTGSAYLRASNFNFNLPANSLIQGFTVVVDMAESSAGSEVVSVQLVGAAATAIGTAKTFTANGTALTLYTTGSATDLWGTTGLTSTDLNDTDFGVYVWYTTTHNTTVDYISIDVNYEPPRTGTLAATETGSDTASISGKVTVKGSLGATETGSDTASFTGKVISGVSGTLAATETGTDTATISGKVTVKGSLAATESGADTAAFSGKVLVAGSLASQETGSDTTSVTGNIIVSGILAAQETGEDTASLTGQVLVSGTLDVTEVGNDTANFVSGSTAITGSLAASETGNDSALFTGVVPQPKKLSGGFAAGPRSAIKAAALRILSLFNNAEPTKAAVKITKKLNEVLSQEKPRAKTVETLADQAIAELTRQQKVAEYVRDIQNIRNLINELQVIKKSVAKQTEAKRQAAKYAAEQDDEEALLLLA